MLSTASVNSLPAQFKRINDIPPIMSSKRSSSMDSGVELFTSCAIPRTQTVGAARAATGITGFFTSTTALGGGANGSTHRGNGSFASAIGISGSTRAPPKPRAPRAKAGARKPSMRDVIDAEERAIFAKHGVDNLDSDDEEESESEAGESDEEFIAPSSGDEVSDYEVSDDDEEEAAESEWEEEGEDSDWEDEEDEILLELAHDQMEHVEDDLKADAELKEALAGTGVSTRVASFAERNAMKKYLTPVEMLYPTNHSLGAYTIKNLIIYLMDSAMHGKYTHRKHDVKPAIARLHAIDETRKRVSLKDGSHDGTVLAYKFHLFLAEKLRLAMLDMNYSPEANAFFQSIAREDLTDGFFIFLAADDTKRCGFTGKTADSVIVLKSFVTYKRVAGLYYSSKTKEGLKFYTFMRFWFLPYIIKCYIENDIEPLWRLDEKQAKRLSPGDLTTHFNNTCQAFAHEGAKKFVDCIGDLFFFVGLNIGINAKVDFK